tara:strand:+ start:3257 stop:4339 length:1083 start_codon:yes stop_codon:yes gene_type:complete
MDKCSIGFVFFGQNRTEYFIKKQILEIEKAQNIFKSKLEFFIIDATIDKIKTVNLERVNLVKSDKVEIEELDPLAKYRSDKHRKISGGATRATIFLQVLDFLEFTNLRKDINFIFRLRTDVFIESELIIKAINNVITPLKKTPYTLFKNKVWVQFFHLFIPFYIHDTAFLISSHDLNLVSEESLKQLDFYPNVTTPSSIWGPIFFKRFPYLYNLAIKFHGESYKRPKLGFNDIKIIPTYWKIISTNFFVSFEPRVKWILQWNLKKVETRTWNNISKKDLQNLSLIQLRFIFHNLDCLIFESDPDFKLINKIVNNNSFNLIGVFFIIKKTFEFSFKIMILIMKKIYKYSIVKINFFLEKDL